MWQRQNDKMQEVTEKEALNKAAAYCSTAERCISEVCNKLRLWGMEQYIPAVTAYLIQERFIDESRYCHCFVQEKIRQNRWGRIKTAQALRQKEIPAPVIQEAINAFDENEYLKILQQLLKAKARTLKPTSTYEKNNRLIRFALSRGFEMPLITRYLHVEEPFD